MLPKAIGIIAPQAPMAHVLGPMAKSPLGNGYLHTAATIANVFFPDIAGESKEERERIQKLRGHVVQAVLIGMDIAVGSGVTPALWTQCGGKAVADTLAAMWAEAHKKQQINGENN